MGGWKTRRPRRFTSGKERVPIVYEAGWATGPDWMGAEKLAPAGIRSSNRPARKESLHRLRYPYPIVHSTATKWTHFLLPVIPETTLTKCIRPEEGGNAILRSIRTNFLSKATS